MSILNVLVVVVLVVIVDAAIVCVVVVTVMEVGDNPCWVNDATIFFVVVVVKVNR